jgi:hypothetical protein
VCCSARLHGPWPAACASNRPDDAKGLSRTAPLGRLETQPQRTGPGHSTHGGTRATVPRPADLVTSAPRLPTLSTKPVGTSALRDLGSGRSPPPTPTLGSPDNRIENELTVNHKPYRIRMNDRVGQGQVCSVPRPGWVAIVNATSG